MFLYLHSDVGCTWLFVIFKEVKYTVTITKHIDRPSDQPAFKKAKLNRIISKMVPGPCEIRLGTFGMGAAIQETIWEDFESIMQSAVDTL